MALLGILFDKDGTLVDFDATWGGATHAVMDLMCGGDRERYARLAEAMHFLPHENRFRPQSPMIAGSTADYMPIWADILGRPAGEPLREEIDRHFVTAAAAHLKALGDPANLFAVLKGRGLKLGVATNDGEAAARDQCRRLGLMPHLDFIAGYDTGHGRKPAAGMVAAFARRIGARPAEVAVVGDSLHDLDAARAAGAIGVAVLSGPASRDVLAPHADFVIEGIADLPALLPSLEAASLSGTER